MNAVVYCRVSTEEQTRNLSLPTQQAACLEYCQRNSAVVVKIFMERGESAKTIDRPELQKMLSYCRENKGRVDLVVVYNLSRLARDTFGHFTVRAFLKKLGVGLHSVTEVIDETSQGRFTENILAAVAQLDNDVRSERTVAGMMTALNRGRWTFIAPIGYRMGDRRSGPSLVPDPDRAPLIAAAFEQVAAGQSRSVVLRRLNALGLRTKKGRKLSLQTFNVLLRNSLYAGRVAVKKGGLRYRLIFPASCRWMSSSGYRRMASYRRY